MALFAENGIENYAVTEQCGVMTLIEPLYSAFGDSVINGKNSKSARKLRSHNIDIDGFVKRQKSYPASKKDLIGQVVGRKTETILDATGGWGGDSLHLCSQGFELQIIERNNVLQGFLREAFARLSNSKWVEMNNVVVPRLMASDAITSMNSPDFLETVDCIYLDPMFPEKRKRSALAKKNMQVLHNLIGEDDDQELLFSTAYKACLRRVVVKRPDYAQSLGESIGVEPSEVLKGKLVHYDIYLKH